MCSGSGTYAAVVGGVNVDIGGQSYAPLVARDSNPGRVRISLGGVGRNIAHNMSLLGVDVRLLTGLRRRPACTARCGLLRRAPASSISHALQVPGGTTSTYLFLNDVDGDMALGLSDMDICERITPAYLASNLSLLNNAQVIVADTNIPAESLQYLVTHCTPPVFVDPVSTAKARKVQPVLGRVHTLKPNRIEAELLSGVQITDEASLRLAASRLLETACTACSSPSVRRACSPPIQKEMLMRRASPRRCATPPVPAMPSWLRSPGPISRARRWPKRHAPLRQPPLSPSRAKKPSTLPCLPTQSAARMAAK